MCLVSHGSIIGPPLPRLQQWSNLTFYPSPYPYCFICYTHIILYTDDIFIFKPISYPSDMLFQLDLDTISFGLFGLLTFFKSIPQNVSTLSFLTNLFPILTHFFLYNYFNFLYTEHFPLFASLASSSHILSILQCMQYIYTHSKCGFFHVYIQPHSISNLFQHAWLYVL